MILACGTTSRRLRRVIVSFELVRPFLAAGAHSHLYNVARDPVPEDAVLINVRSAWPNCIELLLYSETFEEVGEGELPPLLEPTVVNPFAPHAF